MRAGQHFLDCPCAPAHCVLACCGWQYRCTRDCTLAKAPSCVDCSGDCADDEVTFPFHPQQKTTCVVLPLPDLRCTAPRQGCQSWQPQQLTVLTGLFAAAPPLCTDAEFFWYSSLQQGGLLPAARCGSFTCQGYLFCFEGGCLLVEAGTEHVVPISVVFAVPISALK